MKMKVHFYETDRDGRLVGVQVNHGEIVTTRWNELPRNIQWMLAELAAGNCETDFEEIPWFEDWQNGN